MMAVSAVLGDNWMSDEELRTAVSTILLNQATILRILTALLKKRDADKVFDYAKNIEDFSRALMSVLEVENDPTT